MQVELSELERRLIEDGHEIVPLIDGGVGFKVKLTREIIVFLASAIPPANLLYKNKDGFYTRYPFPITLLESIYCKFLNPKYPINIPYYLAPALCILADVTKRTLNSKRPTTKVQDFTKVAEMQERFKRNEFPKSIVVKYPGRSDSITISDTTVILDFWEAFLSNVDTVNILDSPIAIEMILYDTLYPVINNVGNTYIAIIDLLTIAGSQEVLTAGSIEKRIRRQRENPIRQKSKKSL